jgi:hypothetical protein
VLSDFVDIAQVIAMFAALAAVWYAEQAVVETRALRREERVARLLELVGEFGEIGTRVARGLDDRQAEGLKNATCAQAIYVDQSGVTDWLGIVDDISSSGSLSFFRPWTWPRLTPAVAEILSGLGLRAAGGSLCALPSRWKYSPEEEFAAEPEPPAA